MRLSKHKGMPASCKWDVAYCWDHAVESTQLMRRIEQNVRQTQAEDERRLERVREVRQSKKGGTRNSKMSVHFGAFDDKPLGSIDGTCPGSSRLGAPASVLKTAPLHRSSGGLVSSSG